MKRLIGGGVMLLAVLTVLGLSQAAGQTDMTVNTGATGSASYDPFTTGGGPFPFSNFGVQTSGSLGGTNLDLALGGSTTFTLPSFSSGQVLVPTVTNVNVGYTPGWTGSLSSTSNFSASASFVYNIGPFSGSDNIFNQNLNANSTGNRASGGQLVGGNASGSQSGNAFNFGYTASAVVASASATVQVGANYQSGTTWNPNTEYGVYSWLTTAPNQAPTSAPTFTATGSGPLTYTVQPLSFGAAIGTQLYLNFAPGVNLDMTITPTATLSAPVSGDLNVSSFGNTVVNYSFPIGDLFNLSVNYDSWDANVQWSSGYAYSVPVMLESGQVNGTCIDPADNCKEYVVDGDPFTYLVSGLPSSGPTNLTGGLATGNWGPGMNGGLVSPICNPSTGICYQSNDPNIPFGPGTQSSSVTEVPPTAAPEPGGLMLLAVGFGALLAGRAILRS